MSDINPYDAPQAELVQDSEPGEERPLAARSTRLGAAIIDGIIIAACNVPMMMALGTWEMAMSGKTPPFHMTLLGGLLSTIVFLAINGYWLATAGQSVGKKILGIAIVSHTDGSLLSLPKLYALRMLPLGIIALIPVPVLPQLASLADSLSIFRSDRRCIHDLIAGTKVVKVR